ncbi:MAG: hypothetical protein IRZ04_21075, partial [Rhodospirillales bacterium]|nr:hypothetical protein [Rhodospirillales bacterium]
MSQIAPSTASAAAHDALETALAGLDLSWSVLGGLVFGAPPDEIAVDFIALHPERGVALIDALPGGSVDAPAHFRALLDAHGFPAHFPGTLPIVHLRLDAAGAADVARRLEAAFAKIAPLAIRDPRWVAALTDLLTREPEPVPAPEAAFTVPPPARHSEPDPVGAAFARAAERAARPRPSPALRQKPRRRRSAFAAALALLLGAGAGMAAVHWSEGTLLPDFELPSWGAKDAEVANAPPAVAPAPAPSAIPPEPKAPEPAAAASAPRDGTPPPLPSGRESAAAPSKSAGTAPPPAPREAAPPSPPSPGRESATAPPKPAMAAAPPAPPRAPAPA